MRRTGITILLLLYTFIQLGTIALYYADPVIHAICYDLLRFRPGNKVNDHETGECIIRMDLNVFRRSRRDENEIFRDGIFYDIRNIRVNGNTVTLLAEKDLKETYWEAAAEDILHRITSNPLPGSHPDIRFCQWLFKLYVPTESRPSLVRFESLPCRMGYFCHHIPPVFADLPVQPPDVLI